MKSQEVVEISKKSEDVVSINGGTPKWMVSRENPIKRDNFGVPPICGKPHIVDNKMISWSA